MDTRVSIKVDPVGNITDESARECQECRHNDDELGVLRNGERKIGLPR